MNIGFCMDVNQGTKHLVYNPEPRSGSIPVMSRLNPIANPSTTPFIVTEGATPAQGFATTGTRQIHNGSLYRQPGSIALITERQRLNWKSHPIQFC